MGDYEFQIGRTIGMLFLVVFSVLAATGGGIMIGLSGDNKGILGGGVALLSVGVFSCIGACICASRK